MILFRDYLICIREDICRVTIFRLSYVCMHSPTLGVCIYVSSTPSRLFC
jgi:hypothetical protein